LILADARRKLAKFGAHYYCEGPHGPWRIGRRRHARSCTGMSQKKLVHGWSAFIDKARRGGEA